MMKKTLTLDEVRRAVEKLKEAEIPPVKCEDCGTPCYVLQVGFGWVKDPGPFRCSACRDKANPAK